MKLLTYRYNGDEAVGVFDTSGEKIIPIATLGLTYPTMNELIQHATAAELRTLKEAAAKPSPDGIPYDAVTKVAPIPEPRQDVICMGFNYLDHVGESAKFKGLAPPTVPEYPVYFSKRVNCAVADGAPICGHLDLDPQLDYEVELAVIIGKDVKNVLPERATEYIFGYTILNDVSARTLQTRHGQFYFGKGLDDFTPMGPWIVTADEFPDPPQMALRSYVNDELRQDSHTKQMLFPIPRVIAELSAGMTLKAGTIIATGTPAGVGMGFDPPRFLKAGDTVTCEVEGIGRLTNTVG
ncbi:MAG: fumarylacetoacetate hydrolase family protein [Oscillospiraceae bacterium]|nr:fumarylacetoacetate hydrolase family protein [Oscillospiraceae bacterium]